MVSWKADPVEGPRGRCSAIDYGDLNSRLGTGGDRPGCDLLIPRSGQTELDAHGLDPPVRSHDSDVFGVPAALAAAGDRPLDRGGQRLGRHAVPRACRWNPPRPAASGHEPGSDLAHLFR